MRLFDSTNFHMTPFWIDTQKFQYGTLDGIAVCINTLIWMHDSHMLLSNKHCYI